MIFPSSLALALALSLVLTLALITNHLVKLSLPNTCLFFIFQLVFFFSEGTQNLTTDACDGNGAVVVLDVIQDSVYLESPNFPSDYPANQNCLWAFKSACHDVSQT